MKKWTKPTLVCLHRATGDENVLASCKGNGVWGPSLNLCVQPNGTGYCVAVANS